MLANEETGGESQTFYAKLSKKMSEKHCEPYSVDPGRLLAFAYEAIVI